MDTYAALLQNYTGRDKVLRTVSYGAVLLSGSLKGKLAKDILILAKNVSSARTVLRLFDDIPMWTVTRKWGSSDIDLISRICTALGNLGIQLYFPFEHIAWASNQEILPLPAQPFAYASVACWAIFLFFNIIRNLRQLSLFKYKMAKLIKQRKLESPERSGEKDAEFRSKIAELRRAQAKELLILVKNLADAVMAINWLPLGNFLWSGKLSPTRNALFGTISSLIGLYFSVQQIRSAKKSQ